MTQSQTLNVEYDELMARADEIERPLPAIPSTNPPAPCAFSYATDAVAQLAFSADSIRLYLKGCEREWKTLAKSLRNAAKAYEEVDEGAADDIDNEGPASGGTPGVVGGPAEDPAWSPPPPALLAPQAAEDSYIAVREAVMDIEAGDHGAACKAFVQEWHTFRQALQDETHRFRPFTSWEGDAWSAVEQNFEEHRQWITQMVDLCSKLRDQARKIADAQEELRPDTGLAAMNSDFEYTIPDQHPGPVDISTCDEWYTHSGIVKNIAMQWYQTMQQQSEESLKRYATKVALGPLNPGLFPTAAVLGPGLGDDFNPGNPLDGLPLGEALPDPTGMPSGAGAGLGSLPDASKLTDLAAGELASGSGPSTGSGIKPASVGVGGIGGGAPSGPLKPPFFHDPSPPAPGANGAAGLGRAIAGPGAMGAGGMGAAPMAPSGAKGQGGEKGNRMQQDEQALYTERRAWTEGFIGQRSLKLASDNKPVLKPPAYQLLDAS
jgi:hypothetical protein